VCGLFAQEYGVTAAQKKDIGTNICHNLLRKIRFDLMSCRPEVLRCLPGHLAIGTRVTRVGLLEEQRVKKVRCPKRAAR
jgi:hypothetical protein